MSCIAWAPWCLLMGRALRGDEIDSIPQGRVRGLLLENKLRLKKEGLDSLSESSYRQADEMG